MRSLRTSRGSLAGVVLAVSAASFSASAQVTNLTPERFQQYGSDAYWEVEVSCEGYSETVLIRQQVGGANWCMPSRDNYCDTTKVSLSEKVCSAESLAALTPEPEREPESEPEPEPAPRPAVPVPSGPSEAERAAAARAAAEARENRRRAAEAERLRTEQQALLAERRQIEQEKTELSQLESQLQDRVAEIQEQLDNLE